ncbi:GatB/YqeY domain-containing protein [Choiromyces venosus 120613-1]|uniref:Altered inheritance of mitochondria protein 41 n=1 Tax=Choiromyces venosus 120613-1 TaxID=1336337 RepID=A0A3N4J940_9PEZI|nr:GatB/YqeY domain-containing protein [Choiromyces venosus 120613-1]
MLSRTILRSIRVPATAGSRLYSTAQSPPLLLKLRTDLKDAMRNKDTNRLNVIRGILSDLNNASKSPKPPTTDLDILALITETKTKSAASIAEFRAAEREDLVEKESGQVAILDTYAGMVEKVSEGEIRSVVEGVIKTAKEAGERVDMGSIMKKVLAELAGRPAVKGEVAGVVKEAVKAV